MAHVTKVLIAHRDTALRLARRLDNAHLVALPQWFVLIPWTEALAPRAGPGANSIAGTETPDRTEAIHALLLEVSHRAPIVFASTDYFGGCGSQQAEVFRDGGRETVVQEGVAEEEPDAPRGWDWPINWALRSIGVVREKRLDEFDTMRLGAHRFTEGWLEEESMLDDQWGVDN